MKEINNAKDKNVEQIKADRKEATAFEEFLSNLTEKLVKENKITYSLTEGSSAEEEYRVASPKMQELIEKIRREMAQGIHAYVREHGMPTSWPRNESWQKIISFEAPHKGLYREIRFPVTYFGERYPAELDLKAERFYIADGGIRIRPGHQYQSYYSNDGVACFDPEYEKMLATIAAYESEIRSAEDYYNRSQTDARNFSLGSAIGSFIKGIIKAAVCLVIAFIPFAIVARIAMVFLPEVLGLLVGAIAGIIVFVKQCVFWEVWDNLTDITMVKDSSSEFRDAKRKLQEVSGRRKPDIDAIKASESFRLAKQRDEKLRREDRELAESWQRKWYETIIH